MNIKNKMQNLWVRRFFAIAIDFVILMIVMWLIAVIMYPLIIVTGAFFLFNYWLLVAAFVILGYFTYMEGKKGTTIGKKIIKLKVIALNGEMTYEHAFIRNLSKVHWIPLILDVLFGFIEKDPKRKIGFIIKKDSKQRFMDRIANTVVETGKQR